MADDVIMNSEQRVDPIKIPLEKLIKSPNIAELLDGPQLDKLGQDVYLDFNGDVGSRSDWATRNVKAVDLALQVQQKKNFPWTNSSNVKFPIITIAALQFLARVSIMTKGRKIVRAEVVGNDSTGRKTLQANRISNHMSLQLTTEVPNWVDNDEQAKLTACIVGASFKKTSYDPIAGVNISEHVPPMSLVLDYYTKSVETCGRITHIITMSGNDLQERYRRGIFLKTPKDSLNPTNDSTVLALANDSRQGLREPSSNSATEIDVLEQHCWKDFDGDGYAEPYIITIRRDNQRVLRIVARFIDVGDVHRVNDRQVQMLDQQAMQTEDMTLRSELERKAQSFHKQANNHITRIDGTQYFTRYCFIPSPDGGIYGLGLGALLGPLNESVNTLMNQLIDNGTLAVTAGGFLGRGVKMKGGRQTFDPFEWKPVDSTGTDLKNNIVPLPVREPSDVLFKLLAMLIEYAEKLGSATDIMTGVSPGQNTPAETSRNTIEQGMMLFSGIFARMHRSYTEELKKYFRLNQIFLTDSPRWFDLTVGEDKILDKEDYTTNLFRIVPSVSPEAVSQSARKEQAGMLVKLAREEPGFNRYLVMKDFLEVCGVDNVDRIFPDPQGPKAIAPPVPLKVQELQLKLAQADKHHADDMMLAVATLKNEVTVNEARVVELRAKATKELSEANGVDVGHQIALLDLEISETKAKNESIRSTLEILNKMNETKLAAAAKAEAPPPQQKAEGAIDNVT